MKKLFSILLTLFCWMVYVWCSGLVELDYMEYTTDGAAQAAYPSNGHHTITFNANAELDTAIYKFGSASLLVDGSSNISAPDHSDWDLGSNDFRINAWVYLTSYPSINGYTIISHSGSNTNNRGWILSIRDTHKIQFIWSTNGTSWNSVGSTSDISLDTWTHIEVSRSGSNTYLFVNGTLEDTDTSNPTIFSTTGSIALEVGGTSALSEYFVGNIDEVMFINGSAGHTSGFSVPTSPYQIETNTKLLLHLDGADGATSTIDSSRLEAYSESTIKTQGSYSLKGIALATDSLNDTLTRTISPTIDLSDLGTIKLNARASRTGSNFKIGFHDSGGTTTETTPNIASADTFQEVEVDISGVSDANKDAIDSIIVTIVNADSSNTFYLDNMYAETATTDTGNMFLMW